MEGESKEYIYSEDNIKFKDEIYSLKVYLNTEYICFDLILKPNTTNATPEKRFFERYNNTQLGKIDPSFENCDITNNFDDIYEKLEDKKYSIERNESSVKFIIKKNRSTKLTFELKEKIEDDNINYDILSDEMKKIIDNHELIIGIDLGTTNSCAAVLIDDKVIVIPNSLGSKTTASYVFFLSKDLVCVGDLAKLFPSFESNIIYNTKRLIGRSYNDKEIKEILEKKLLNYEIIEDKEFNSLKIKIKLDDNSEIYYYPEQICALILKQIVSDSECYLTNKIGKNIKIKNVVITIPSNFNQKQRRATKNAALIAGLNVKGMINEPTAACLAYSYESLENKKNYIVVIDFGGGTLDLTLIKFEKDERGNYCVVKFTHGNSNFGGDDFDTILMEHCLKEKHILKINKNLPENKRLKEVCENAKIKLSKYGTVKSDDKSEKDDKMDDKLKNNDKSNDKKVKIFLEEYRPKVNLDIDISQTQFNEYSKDFYDKFKKVLEDFKKDCLVNIDEIKEVILIGGTTFLPKIEEIVEEEFGKNKIKKTSNRKEAVAIGAAIKAAKISNLSKVNNIKLLDVTNLSLGVDTQGNKMSIIIPRSSPLPIQKFERYQTVEDNGREKDSVITWVIPIKVFEGENEDNSNNLFLGEFRIRVPKKKEGRARIIVYFEIDDKTSLLNVTAIEKDNKDNSVQKTYSYDANEEKIKEIHSKKLEIIETKNIGQIIDNLKINNIQFFEFEIIKDSILEKEEKINEFLKKKDEITKNIGVLKGEINEFSNNKEELTRKIEQLEELVKQEDSYKENIKHLNQELLKIFSSYGEQLINEINDIEKFGNLEQRKKMKLKIFFSFVKYFCKKVNEYFSECVSENEYDKNKKENNLIKKNLNNFLEVIQYNNINLIYEIIDNCEFDNEILEVYISFLIKNYDQILNEKYYSAKLEDLKELEYIIKRAIFLLGKIKELPNDLKNKEKYFKDYIIKIKGKEIILKGISDENIDNIINDYENSLFLDIETIKDLQMLINLREKNSKSEDIIKAQLFIGKLNTFYEDYNWNNWENFVYILEQYPPKESFLKQIYKNKDRPYYHLVKNNYFMGRNLWEGFLERMSDVYNNMRESEKNNAKSSIYFEITKFLNFAREKEKI